MVKKSRLMRVGEKFYRIAKEESEKSNINMTLTTEQMAKFIKEKGFIPSKVKEKRRKKRVFTIQK